MELIITFAFVHWISFEIVIKYNIPTSISISFDVLLRVGFAFKSIFINVAKKKNMCVRNKADIRKF